MDYELKMPDLATTGSQIKVLSWLIDIGQEVKRGQAVLEIETDKAAMEVESVVNGKLKEKKTNPGDEVDGGQIIAILDVLDGAASSLAASMPAPVAATETASKSPVPGAKKAGGMFAKNREAAKTGTDKKALSLSPARRTAARRLQESKQTIPHFYLGTSLNAEPMMARRLAAQPKKLAWDAFFVHAIAKSLERFEQMRCRWEDGQLFPAETSAVGVATDINGDLHVLSIPDPATKTPEEISDFIRAGVEQLRRGEPGATRMQPCVMSVTNLGGSNVESFTAIINPPESAILAIGKTICAPVVKDGAVVMQNRVFITLSVDHRIVNGKYAAEFLGAIVSELESL